MRIDNPYGDGSGWTNLSAANIVGTISDSVSSNKWDSSYTTVQSNSAAWSADYIQIACSDLTTDLAITTPAAYLRMPYAMTLTEIRASVLTAPTGTTPLVIDINKNNSSILSTRLSLSGVDTTVGSPSAAVISTPTLADDDKISIDIDSVGSTIAGAGLIVTLLGRRT